MSFLLSTLAFLLGAVNRFESRVFGVLDTTAGREWAHSGALTYLGSAAAQQRGVEVAETGIAVEEVIVEYFPEVDEFRQNNIGESDGAAVSTTPSRDISISGEVTGSTGRMADTFVAAITSIANDLTTFGGSGGIYMKRAVETQRRADWRKVALSYKSRPGIA
jgi:hypothetical protein